MFPPDTLNEDDFERIVSDLEVDVNVESLSLKSKVLHLMEMKNLTNDSR
jgi:hypothetical protein